MVIVPEDVRVMLQEMQIPIGEVVLARQIVVEAVLEVVLVEALVQVVLQEVLLMEEVLVGVVATVLVVEAVLADVEDVLGIALDALALAEAHVLVNAIVAAV
jgi:hypothetical protein